LYYQNEKFWNEELTAENMEMSQTETGEGTAAIISTPEAEITAPLVFFCSKCRTIVGDSFSFITSNQDANTLTISAASNIKRTTELYTSYEALDEGSTYFFFLCSCCQQILGRYYVTTSQDLDHIREKFTFSIDNIFSYELGKAQHGKMPEATVISVPSTGATGGSSSSAAEIADESALSIVQDDVIKVRIPVLFLFFDLSV
jgi:hypothetical protein